MTERSPAIERGKLSLYCSKCTRVQAVFGPDEESCQEAAYDHGWRSAGTRMICPSCPAMRERKRAA